MRNTVFTVMLSLASMGCAFYAMAYPAWFQQHYRRDGNNVFQGFGLFAFYSTGSLRSPFYSSVTTLQYSDFCDSTTTPNYMLGDGDAFRLVLCHKGMLSVQATTCTGAAVSVVGLLAAIAAVFNPSAGYAERVVSFCTLVGSLLLAVALVIWGWVIQQRLYQVDSINSAYTDCKADHTKWHCWFYGYSFWVCLASVIVLSITGYMSSAGRAEKIRYFRKEYERDLAVAVQASMEQDAAAAALAQQQQQQAHSNFVRSDTANFAQQPTPPNYMLQQPYTSGKPPVGYAAGPAAQPLANAPTLSAASSSSSTSRQASNVSNQSGQHEVEAAYPEFRQQRQNHSLLGRQPSGGVV